MIIRVFLLFFFWGLMSATYANDEEARLLRFPSAHDDQVVFTYAGDLYTVDRSGGVARKLTSHPGMKIFPRFSNDGSKIAFTGQYDGNTEVFVIPAEGGEPERITYTTTLARDDVSDRMGPNNIVMTWTPDDEHVVFRTRDNSFNAFKGVLKKAPLDGGMPEQLPFSVASWCSYTEDGTELAHNRVFREFRTWKYYRGGQADDIWIFNFETGETENITNHNSQDVFPMVHGDRVFFASDRDRIMNLFAYDRNTGETTKVTDFDEYDIKWPNINNGLITFENGGYIYIYDIEQEELQQVEVFLKDDHPFGRNKRVDATENIYSGDISPDGNRAVFSARGDIFTVPAKSGVTRNLTRSSGAHDRFVSWSPNGKWIAYISDKTGEDELFVIPADGSGEARQLSDDGAPYKYQMAWSPDSEKIALSDRSHHLYYYDVESGDRTTVTHCPDWEIRDFSWSWDSEWLAYAFPNQRAVTQIFLYSLDSEDNFPVTDEWYNASSPRFSKDGKFLYFVSQREFNPIYSNAEWNHAFIDMGNLFVLHLTSETESIHKKENQEAETEDEEENGDNGNDENGEEAESKLTVDREGIFHRVEDLGTSAGNYWNLQVAEDGIFYNYRAHNKGSEVKFYKFSDKSETTIGTFNGFTASHDRKKVLIRRGSDFFIEELQRREIKPENKLDMSAVVVNVDRLEEWTQIYHETWRQMRDFFYDPDMHGVDWEAIRDKYEVFLPHIRHRNDLTYIMGEMIGELNVGHAYVNNGDRPDVERTPMGKLGAEFSLHESGYYQIDRILQGANWMDNMKSPLAAVGLNVEEGDYIIAINGVSTTEMSNIFEGLIGTAGKTVELKISSEPSADDARMIYVNPIADQSNLYYLEWINQNIARVDELSDGRIGYIHVPDMGPGGLVKFMRYFYPQLSKEALIIDVRGNGGGNVSPMLIERLRRELVFGTSWRNAERAGTRPAQIHLGPKACLIDQYSASDGDLFPYQFQYYGLGPLIGQRSWGGVVGIRGSQPFVDGADLRKPEFGHFDPETGEWVIEGYGVDPDIEVVNDPHREYLGEDAQLERAVEELLRELEENPVEFPEIPPFPVKID
ncbi:MAG: protease [Saprospirales bacterium]|nr:MAG: protease [Saprospirales bacterium]